MGKKLSREVTLLQQWSMRDVTAEYGWMNGEESKTRDCRRATSDERHG